MGTQVQMRMFIFYFQVERKRHIGNDIVNIIFIDGDSCDFTPNWIKSQFTRILFKNRLLWLDEFDFFQFELCAFLVK